MIGRATTLSHAEVATLVALGPVVALQHVEVEARRGEHAEHRDVDQAHREQHERAEPQRAQRLASTEGIELSGPRHNSDICVALRWMRRRHRAASS